MKRLHFVLLVLAFGCGGNLGFSQTALYDRTQVQELKIYFHESNWDFILDTLKINDGGYWQADSVFINGQKFDSVGVKYKGNSSYDSSRVKNPLTIKLNEYVDQDYQGYKSLKLANCFDDPSMIREPLAYSILSNYMHCPQSNFMKVYINDNYIGVYSNDEDITKKFALKHFYSSGNPFFKASPEFATPAYKASLKYIDDSTASYKPLYEKESSSGWSEFIALCDTVTNSPSSVGTLLDMDRVVWMLAFDNVLVNLDSYLGVFSQNYFLYKDDNNYWNPVIWDLNMSFGGFNYIGSPNNGMGTMALSDMVNLSPLAHSTHTDWPLVKAVFANDVYKRKYMAHYRTILNEMFASGVYIDMAQEMQATVGDAVLADANKFFSDQDFTDGLTADKIVNGRTVPGLQNLMDARVAYLQTETEFVKTPPAVSNIWLSDYSSAIGSSVNVQVTATNATSVLFAYRSDSTFKFSLFELYDDGNHQDELAGDHIYGGNFTIDSAYTEYYVYAENTQAGIFFPARAEYEFYTLPGNAPVLNVSELVSDPDFTIYPNPATDAFVVDFGTSSEGADVQVMDVFGNVIRELSAGSKVYVNASDFQSGTYLVKAGNRIKRIVVLD